MPDLTDNEAPAQLDTHRFFVVESDAVYESVRAGLDLDFGHPHGGTATCIPPAADARHNAQGKPYVAVEWAQCLWPVVATALAELTGAGLVQETTRADWDASAPESTE